MDVVIFGFAFNPAILWLGAAIVFGIIEAATTSLTTIWFVIGAVVSAIVSICGIGILGQIIVFLVVSILLLVVTRPIVKKRMNVGSERTNVDALIGKEVKVVKSVEPFEAGEARINGLTWVAIGSDEKERISEGSIAKIVAVKGVKLVLTQKSNRR